MGIFDELVTGINREIAKVQSRSQEMIETYNMTSQVKALEGKITATFIEIGRLVYDKYQRHQEVLEDTLKEKTKAIALYEQEITVLKSDIEARRAIYDPNTPASQKADAKAGCAPTPGFLCPHCQAPANKEKTFCPLCGGSLEDSGAQAKSDSNGDF